MKALYRLSISSVLLYPVAMAEPQVPESALTICTAPYLRVQQELLTLHRELGVCLQGVQDKESADKVAESVKSLTARLLILQEQERKLPAPPAYIAASIEQNRAQVNYKELIEQGVGKAIDLCICQDPPCYGSTALAEALTELLHRLSGGL